MKAVVGQDGFALYFSRAAVPYDRTAGHPGSHAAVPVRAFKHIGLYAYRRATVLRLAALPPTALEETEMLEQLRALEHGIRIKVVQTELDSIGVDTDAEWRACARCSRRHRPSPCRPFTIMPSPAPSSKPAISSSPAASSRRSAGPAAPRMPVEGHG